MLCQVMVAFMRNIFNFWRIYVHRRRKTTKNTQSLKHIFSVFLLQCSKSVSLPLLLPSPTLLLLLNTSFLLLSRFPPPTHPSTPPLVFLPIHPPQHTLPLFLFLPHPPFTTLPYYSSSFMFSASTSYHAQSSTSGYKWITPFGRPTNSAIPPDNFEMLSCQLDFCGLLLTE